MQFVLIILGQIWVEPMRHEALRKVRRRRLGLQQELLPQAVIRLAFSGKIIKLFPGNYFFLKGVIRSNSD
jgi:hypothetical protein